MHGAEVQGEGTGVDEAVSEQSADVEAELMLQAEVADQHRAAVLFSPQLRAERLRKPQVPDGEVLVGDSTRR